MSKYVLLIILNAPLVLYALFNVFVSYKMKRHSQLQTAIRFIFWGLILVAIFCNKPITDFLYSHELTNSPPLSIFDVFLCTGTIISLLLLGRAYGRITQLEDRFTELQEVISLRSSTPTKRK